MRETLFMLLLSSQKKTFASSSSTCLQGRESGWKKGGKGPASWKRRTGCVVPGTEKEVVAQKTGERKEGGEEGVAEQGGREAQTHSQWGRE